MSSEAGAQTSAQPVEPPQLNFFERLVGVYFSPTATFEDINRKGAWIGLFIVICVLAIGAQYVMRTRMDRETIIRKSMEMSPIRLSEEQIQTAIAQPETAFQKYSGAIFAPIGILVFYVIVATVFLVAFILQGVSIPFKKALAVTVWGQAPPGLIAGLLGILFMYIKDPATLELEPAGNVASNLGLLVSAREHPVLHSVLYSIDVFSFWQIALLGIGFAAVSNRKLTTGKATTTIIVVWVLYVLGKMGFKALFS
jgi:hypothetical protein